MSHCVFHIQAVSMLCAHPSLKICLIFVLEPLRFLNCLADPLDWHSSLAIG